MQLLYLHGFASGVKSTKATAFARRFPAVDVLDLRVPSFEHLRLSAMIEVTIGAIRGDCVLVGSSLGGLTAARVAERDARVKRLVLLAPAFQIAARWRDQLGPAWDEWKRTGWREVLDHTNGKQARVDFGFIEDAERVDYPSAPPSGGAARPGEAGAFAIGYPDVTVPALVFHGVRDDAVPVEQSRTFAAGRANVRLVELDDDHQLVASVPRILDEAADFLR